MQEIIQLKNINFTYTEEDLRPALKDVSFSINKGEWIAIIGPNGSGKSTLAKTINGLVEAKSGEVIIGGTTLSEETVWEIRRKVGMVFQNPDNQFVGSTVQDDIAFGLENRCVHPEGMEEIIEKFAKEVGMSDYLKHEPGKLSGGQKQRVAIAGVLAMNPDILILDEATSMLDPKGKLEVNNLVHKLHKENQMTILSITHDIEEVVFSDYVIVMSDGKVQMQGTPQEILSKVKRLVYLSLDVPFSVKFYLAIKKLGIKLSDPFDLEGMVDELWELNSNQ